MRHTSIKTIVVWALALLATGSWVLARAGSEVVTLRWEDIERAVEQHPAMQAAASEADAASAEAAASRQYPNPTFGVGLGRAEAVEGEEEDRVWGLELTLPILSPWAYRSSIAAADAEQGAIAQDAAVVRLEVIEQLKESFWGVVYDQQWLDVVQVSRGQVASLVEVAELRVNMGEARPSEVTRLEIELARLDVEIRRATEEAQARKEILDLLLRSALSVDLRVDGDITVLPDLCSVDDAVTQGLSQHPRLHAANLRIRSSAARLREERAKRLPEFAIGAFYEKELDAKSYGGTVEVSIPLWNWNSAQIARSKAMVKASVWGRDLVRMEMEAAVREAHAAAAAAFGKAQVFREVVLPMAVDVAAALEQMYQVGEEDVMNVLDARRELVEIESELLEVSLESQLAHARLVTLMGGKEHE